jgi:thymidine kinase
MLIVVCGPMMSGKSYELIKYAQAYIAQGKKLTCIQPKLDTRNDGIWSRAGSKLDAMRVDSLSEVPESEVYIIDEAHFLSFDDAKIIEHWLETSDVVVGGLDVGHQRELMPFYQKLYELKPDILISKVAECTVCHSYNATYTQILSDGVPVVDDLDEMPVENGTFEYEPRCRRCFIT